MPSEQPRRRLRDILDNIRRIERHIEGMDLASYIADERTRDAVERCLQRITEAARKLGPTIEERHPDIPWRAIREMGSVLRHDYDEITDELVWKTVTTRLTPLRRVCEDELND